MTKKIEKLDIDRIAVNIYDSGFSPELIDVIEELREKLNEVIEFLNNLEKK